MRFWRWLCGLFRWRRRVNEPETKPAPTPEKARPAWRQGETKPAPKIINPLAQVPVTEADIERLGREAAVSRALEANRERLRRCLARTHDGQMYYRDPDAHGRTFSKTDGKAMNMPDGTIKLLPADPRLSKRERAKLKRALKRKQV